MLSYNTQTIDSKMKFRIVQLQGSQNRDRFKFQAILTVHRTFVYFLLFLFK